MADGDPLDRALRSSSSSSRWSPSWASSRRAGAGAETLAHLDEWGLGGRQFGTWITWFLVGGDFYTAYTVIAVPALVYAVGAYGFFALPYTILVYPFVFVVMPGLWKRAQGRGYVTAADVVHGHYGSRALELAVAVTGVVATMPYIALQLVGMAVVIKALGAAPASCRWSAAFVILALYTYSAGPARAGADRLRQGHDDLHRGAGGGGADARSKLGGYAAVFAAAGRRLRGQGRRDRPAR